MAEWSIAQPWKGCERLRVPRVRIPVCPPLQYIYSVSPRVSIPLL